MYPRDMLFGNEKEEYFTNRFGDDFPIAAVLSEFDELTDREYGWHWHNEIEMFLVEQGTIRYQAGGLDRILRQGEAGLVNANVLHRMMSAGDFRQDQSRTFNFDPILLSGKAGSAIDRKYIQPFLRCSQLPLLVFSAEDPRTRLLADIRDLLLQKPKGYEMRVPGLLSELWLYTLEENETLLSSSREEKRTDDARIKQMLRFIQENYADGITIGEIAEAASISSRECQRCFKRNLSCSPVEFLTRTRITHAAFALSQTDEPILDVALSCGFGSASYFGKKFYEAMHMTPREYRKRRKDSMIN